METVWFKLTMTCIKCNREIELEKDHGLVFREVDPDDECGCDAEDVYPEELPEGCQCGYYDSLRIIDEKTYIPEPSPFPWKPEDESKFCSCGEKEVIIKIKPESAQEIEPIRIHEELTIFSDDGRLYTWIWYWS